MPTRLLKLKATLPFPLETLVIHKYGYAVERRVASDFIVFKKSYISDRAIDAGLKRTIRASVNDNVVKGDFKNKLTPHQTKALEKRCDNIVAFFPDPYSVVESVRARLKILMQHLSAPEAQFVLEYMDENFPITDKGK